LTGRERWVTRWGLILVMESTRSASVTSLGFPVHSTQNRSVSVISRFIPFLINRVLKP